MNEHYSLTAHETALLRKHRSFYDALARGDRQPRTQAQKHFVAVSSGRAKAETPHEIAYVKVRIEEARIKRSLRVNDDHGDKYWGEGNPRPGWFTDKGWKRMRAGYLSDCKHW